MTKPQIKKKLHDAGITEHVTITGKEVEVMVPSDVEGVADYDKTQELGQRVMELLGFSGYKTGYHSWILTEGYKVSPYEGLADPMHY